MNPDSNFRSLRNQIASGILPGYVLGVDKGSIARGVGNPYSGTWSGPTGVVAKNFIDGDNRADWSWHTSLTKKGDTINNPVDYSTGWAVLAQEDWQPVWGSGIEFYAEKDCLVNISAYADLICPVYNHFGFDRRKGESASIIKPGLSSEIRLEYFNATTGWIPVQVTTAYSFGEPGMSTLPTELTNERWTGITRNDGNRPPRVFQRRFMTATGIVGFESGPVKLRLAVNCRTERTYVTTRSIVAVARYTTQSL
jgi:hypothetical protein